MMLVLVPQGRGNWAPITLAVSGLRLGPVDFFVGQRVLLGGQEWRVSKVLP